MVTILVADNDDGEFSAELSDALSGYFNEGELKLYDIKSSPPTVNDSVIVVYKQPQPTVFQFQGSGVAVAIVDSGDEALLEHVSGTRLPAITCGLRSRDTITLSSMAKKSTVIDLRRSVSCLDGSTVEPQEIPLRHKKTNDNFLLMTMAAILILCGKVEKLKEGYI